MSDASPLPSQALALATSPWPKVSREQLKTLFVEADDCPHALMRVLGFVTQLGIAPMTISAACTEEAQHIAIELTASEQLSERLVAKIGSIVSVRHVQFGRSGASQAWAPPSHKA